MPKPKKKEPAIPAHLAARAYGPRFAAKTLKDSFRKWAERMKDRSDRAKRIRMIENGKRLMTAAEWQEIEDKRAKKRKNEDYQRELDKKAIKQRIAVEADDPYFKDMRKKAIKKRLK